MFPCNSGNWSQNALFHSYFSTCCTNGKRVNDSYQPFCEERSFGLVRCCTTHLGLSGGLCGVNGEKTGPFLFLCPAMRNKHIVKKQTHCMHRGFTIHSLNYYSKQNTTQSCVTG